MFNVVRFTSSCTANTLCNVVPALITHYSFRKLESYAQIIQVFNDWETQIVK